MNEFKNQIIQNKDQLANLITLETGKVIKQSYLEVNKCINHIEYYDQVADEFLQDKNYPSSFSKSYVKYQPLGIVHLILPFNFPLWLNLKSAVPILLSGNSVAVRGADTTPQLSELVQKLADNSFQGHYQTLFSSHEQLSNVLQHKYVNGLMYIGSTEAGQVIGVECARNVIKSSMELSGNDPFVVFEGADLELAASIAVNKKIAATGQVCVAPKRFIIQEEIFTQFVEILKSKLEKVNIGDPSLETTDMGPLAKQSILDKLNWQLKKSQEMGAQHIYTKKHNQKNGFFCDIQMLQVKQDNMLFQEEVFAPVLPLIQFKTKDEAIALANDSNLGLGGMVFGEQSLAEEVALKLETGMVTINADMNSHSGLPFGGMKQSGYGRECADYGLLTFTNPKLICK